MPCVRACTLAPGADVLSGGNVALVLFTLVLACVCAAAVVAMLKTARKH